MEEEIAKKYFGGNINIARGLIELAKDLDPDCIEGHDYYSDLECSLRDEHEYYAFYHACDYLCLEGNPYSCSDKMNEIITKILHYGE